MIDLTRLREEPAHIAYLIKLKDPNFDTDKLIKLNLEVRELRETIEQLRHTKNELAAAGKSGITEELKEKSKKVSLELKEKEEHFEKINCEFKNLYLRCPNLPMEDLPQGGKEANKVIKIWGKKAEFNFEPRNHVELGKINNWFDFEAAARMTATNFALYKNDAVKAVYGLMLFMLNNNYKYGFAPILPPYLVNEKTLIGASNFPRFTEEVYSICDDNLYLTPTAEVNLTAIYRDHTFTPEDLPICMTAWTSCFRREAGNYGATERGLIRIHQFEKAELYTICEPKDADAQQHKMLECAESILQALGLHYRVSLLATQDCSFASAKTYDIEVWMPGQGVYKEVSSISNCTDFQARRSEIRFKENQGAKSQFVYTLNGSSLALPRLMVALMETYQQQDGSIALPHILKQVTLNLW